MSIIKKFHRLLGTGILEPEYFYLSRNLSFIIDSPAMAQTMTGIFDQYWNSTYTTELHLDRSGIMKSSDD